jgi:hypothetical protein
LTSLTTETRQLIPEIVVKEFAEEGYAVNSGVTEEVSRKTQQAWTRHSAFS